MTHKVYGVNFLVQVLSEPPAGMTIHCPRGSPIRYGRVVAAGDGFDAGAVLLQIVVPLPEGRCVALIRLRQLDSAAVLTYLDMA